MNWTVRTPPRKDIVSPAAEVSPRPQARYIPVLEDCRILKSALLSLAGTQKKIPCRVPRPEGVGDVFE